MLTAQGFKEKTKTDQPQVLPHNAEAEEALLGGLMIDPDQMLEVSYLEPTDFYLTLHARLYQVLQGLFQKSRAYDYVTVCDELARRGWLDDFGGAAGLTDLINQSFLSINSSGLAEIVYRDSVRRQTIRACTEITQSAYGSELTAEDLVNKAMSQITSVNAARNVSSGPQSLTRGVEVLFDTVERIQAGEDRAIMTGLKDLDRLLNGLQQDKLYLLAGRPGMGKSSLALQIAYNVAKRGQRVLIFSLEMGLLDITARLVSIDSRIPYEQFRGKGDYDNSKFIVSSNAVASLPITVDDTPALTVPQIHNIAQKEIVQGGVDLVIVDHLGIIESGIRGGAYERVSFVADQLMALPKKLGVPVLAVCQLGRSVESSHDKRPAMVHLRDTGKLEENADGILFLYRDEVYNSDTQFPNIAEVIIGKNRGGQTGAISLYGNIACSRFVSLEIEKRGLV